MNRSKEQLFEIVANECSAVIQSLFAIKADVKDECDLYEHPTYEQAYARLWTVAKEYFDLTGGSVMWETDVAWITAHYVSEVWRQDCSSQDKLASVAFQAK